MAETRSERIAIKVTPQVHAELKRLADEIGQTPSTLAAVYLGEMINKKRAERETNQRIAEAVGSSVKERLEPMALAFDQAMADRLPEEI